MTDKEFNIQKALGTLPLFKITVGYLVSGTTINTKGWPTTLRRRGYDIVAVAQAALDFLIFTCDIPARNIESVTARNLTNKMQLYYPKICDLKRYKSVPK